MGSCCRPGKQGQFIQSSPCIKPSGSQTSLSLGREQTPLVVEVNPLDLAESPVREISPIRIKRTRHKGKFKQVLQRLNSFHSSELPSANLVKRPKQPEEIDLILEVLQGNFIFNSLVDIDYQEIIDNMQGYYLGEKEPIFLEGHEASFFYIV